MIFRKKITFLIIAFFISCTSQAQIDTADFRKLMDSLQISIEDLLDLKPAKKSHFKIQASYLTNYVYGGRKDSVDYPYLTPSIEYNHKSGLYASFSGSYLTAVSPRWDVRNIEVGYSFDIKKLSTSTYVSRAFYNTQSQNVQNDVSWTIGTNLTYDAKYINISFAPSLFIGSNTDFAFSAQLDHPFYFENKQATHSFTLTPTLTAVFGNTGFYQTYKRKQKVGQGQGPGVTQTVTSPRKLQMLSYEFSLPIYFDKEKWGVFIVPTYAIAVNPVVSTVKFTGPNGNLIPSSLLGGIPNPYTITESLSNSFFAEFGVYYKF